MISQPLCELKIGIDTHLDTWNNKVGNIILKRTCKTKWTHFETALLEHYGPIV